MCTSFLEGGSETIIPQETTETISNLKRNGCGKLSGRSTSKRGNGWCKRKTKIQEKMKSKILNTQNKVILDFNQPPSPAEILNQNSNFQQLSPVKPKKALTPFICFVKQNSQGKYNVKTLAQLWNSMRDKEKYPYFNLAEKDNERFKTELNEYQNRMKEPLAATEFQKRALEIQETKKKTHQKVQTEESMKLDQAVQTPFNPNSKSEDSGKDLTAYLFFVQQYFSFAMGEKYECLMNKCSEDWRNFNKAYRQKYYLQAHQQFHNYPFSNQHSHSQEVVEEIENIIPDSKKEVGEIQNVIAEKDEKPKTPTIQAVKNEKVRRPSRNDKDVIQPRKVCTPFHFFVKDKMKEIITQYKVKPQKATQIIGVLWKQLTNQQMKPYIELTKLDTLRFDRQSQDLKEKGYFVLENGTKSTDLPSNMSSQKRRKLMGIRAQPSHTVQNKSITQNEADQQIEVKIQPICEEQIWQKVPDLISDLKQFNSPPSDQESSEEVTNDGQYPSSCESDDECIDQETIAERPSLPQQRSLTLKQWIARHKSYSQAEHVNKRQKIEE